MSPSTPPRSPTPRPQPHGTGELYIDGVEIVGLDTTTVTATSTTVSSSTSSTGTTTTNTVLAALQRNGNELHDRMTDVEGAIVTQEQLLVARVDAQAKQLEQVLKDLKRLSDQNRALEIKLAAAITDRISPLEAKLAADGPDGKLLVRPMEVDNATCSLECGGAPTLQADADGLTMDACCGTVVLQEGRCTVEPCELQQRLDALQAKLGL